MNKECCWKCAAAGTAFSILSCLQGCNTDWQTVGLAALGTAYLARTPAHEIEQIYYLGIFDPAQRVPQALYRVRIHGQASAMSKVRFASGWVPAEFVDPLASLISLKLEDGKITFSKDQDETHSFKLGTGDRMILFGPEGYREAPRDHRLVVVMGSQANDYFGAVDSLIIQMTKAPMASEIAANSTAERQSLQIEVGGEILQITRLQGGWQ